MSDSKSVRICAILVAPAEYTMDLIRNVYSRRDVDYVFMYGTSAASQINLATQERRPLGDLPILYCLRNLLRLIGSYDAFILNGYTGKVQIFFILLNCLFFRKKFAIESDTEFHELANPLKRMIKSIWLRWVFTRVFCYAFPGGGFDHRKLFKYYGMADDRIFVMPMVVDNARHTRINAKVDDGVFRFGYMGRLVHLKQVERALRAFSFLSEEMNVEFHVVGDGKLRSDLETKYGANKRVVFHGAVFGSEKIKVLHKIDCLVLYSYYEPWGLVVNEALAAGIPCIVSDRVGSRHELVEPPEATGIVVPWNDDGELLRAMRKMCEDREAFQICCRNAKARMSRWNYATYLSNFDLFLRHVQEVKVG